MGYGMTRRSASRGILYSTPPSPDNNDAEQAADASAEADETAPDTETATADD
jgi:hypothetical protein